MANAKFQVGMIYETIDNVDYECVGITEKATVFRCVKDGWVVEAYDARFVDDGQRIAWGSTYGYQPEDHME